MSGAGENFARDALAKLLARAEKAWCRGADRNGVSLKFSEATQPGYFKLPLRSDKDAANAVIRGQERLGVISIEWDQWAGDGAQITRIVLKDADALAQALRSLPIWKACQEAAGRLHPLLQDFPCIAPLLESWRAGKLVHGLDPTRAVDLLDAAKVIKACKEQDAEDVAIRRLSTALFADSKRIEKLVAALDILSADSFDTPWREEEEVFGALGLVKFPQPLLVAGEGVITLDGGRIIEIPKPYVGVPPQAVTNIMTGGRYVLTVENLTTFHELAAGKAGAINGLLLYTGGMPAPSFLRVYGKAIQEGRLDRYHWGDIDLGGFRIAARLANIAPIPLRLWSMDSAAWTDAESRKVLSDAEVDAIGRICKAFGWEVEGVSVERYRRGIEQEALPLDVPG